MSTVWSAAPLDALCSHLESSHRTYLESELVRVGGLLDKAASVHGAARPSLVELARTFRDFTHRLRAHMHREERALFPAIRELASGRPLLDLSLPLRIASEEHVELSEALGRMRQLAADTARRDGDAGIIRAALGALREIADELDRRVYLEDQILFRRSLGATPSRR